MASLSFGHGLRGVRRLFSGADRLAGLNELLQRADADQDLIERLHWLDQVLRWLKRGHGKGGPAEVRFRYLFLVLQQQPAWRARFQAVVLSIVRDASFLRFFSDTGYAAEHGLWADAVRRVFRRFLPGPFTGDFQTVILGAFPYLSDAAWLEELPDAVLLEFWELCAGHAPGTASSDRAWGALGDELREALLMLSANVAHHGLTVDVRHRLEDRGIGASSFWGLSAAVQRLLADTAQLLELPRTEQDPDSFAAGVRRCRTDIELVYRSMEDSGVSVGVVHRLELLAAMLDQMEALLRLSALKSPIAQAREVRGFMARAAQAGARGRSVRGHLGRHFYLLARKVAERNGYSGEHYVAHTRAELGELLRTALGGGVIVVAMTILKVLVVRTGLPPLFMGLAIWAVYSGGFLTMQFLGCTLATKMPSFTASLLAKRLKAARSRHEIREFAGEVKLIVQSQLVALAGNLLAAVPLSLALDALFKLLFHGNTLVGHAYAEHTLAALDPLHSAVIPLAALTGVLLWISSLCGGWFENWVVFQGIPELIEHHPRVRQVFGPARAATFARWTLQNVSSMAVNVALGFLLAFTPVIGPFFGLNLEGKHVTLSSSLATFSAAKLGSGLPFREIAWTVTGLLIVGLLNFTVSFALALTVAARAQSVRSAWIRELFRFVLRPGVSRGRSPRQKSSA